MSDPASYERAAKEIYDREISLPKAPMSGSIQRIATILRREFPAPSTATQRLVAVLVRSEALVLDRVGTKPVEAVERIANILDEYRFPGVLAHTYAASERNHMNSEPAKHDTPAPSVAPQPRPNAVPSERGWYECRSKWNESICHLWWNGKRLWARTHNIAEEQVIDNYTDFIGPLVAGYEELRAAAEAMKRACDIADENMCRASFSVPLRERKELSWAIDQCREATKAFSALSPRHQPQEPSR